MKRIIFFDADGTLWYPKKTRFEEKPWWIYDHPTIKREDPLKHLTLTPNVKKTLKRLHEMGLILVLISQSPYSKRRATDKLVRATKQFGIYRFFDEIRPSYSSIKVGQADPKDVAILDVLKRRKISKRDALLIGDSYMYDYLAAKSCGVDCVLVHDFKHTREDRQYKRVNRRIKDIYNIFKYVN